MPLRIFIPDWTNEVYLPSAIPPLYPFLKKQKTNEELIGMYGAWIDEIEIVSSVAICDIVVLLYEVGYYYKNHLVDQLKKINADAASAGKLTLCWSKGDEGITPDLLNYHLYRLGGYRSKNKGNQFLSPVFIEDPLPKYFGNQLQFQPKTPKPVIGFCGQGKASIAKFIVDFFRGYKNRIEKIIGTNFYDVETLESSTLKRSNLLDILEKSALVNTNFIRHTRYRAGQSGKDGKEASSKIFFTNMLQSQYIVCYRGAGNFSVRLYETLASGRIPIIVLSDNNLPFEDEINWNIFPIIASEKWEETGKIVSAFHALLSEEAFIALQKNAREIYEQYISYNGFMCRWVKKYEGEKNRHQNISSANISI